MNKLAKGLLAFAVYEVIACRALYCVNNNKPFFGDLGKIFKKETREQARQKVVLDNAQFQIV